MLPHVCRACDVGATCCTLGALWSDLPLCFSSNNYRHPELKSIAPCFQACISKIGTSRLLCTSPSAALSICCIICPPSGRGVASAGRSETPGLLMHAGMTLILTNVPSGDSCRMRWTYSHVLGSMVCWNLLLAL